MGFFFVGKLHRWLSGLRRGTANPHFVGSNPTLCSKFEAEMIITYGQWAAESTKLNVVSYGDTKLDALVGLKQMIRMILRKRVGMQTVKQVVCKTMT